ncbi:MAG: metal ABC transporter permease [Fusobacteria bacterium]|nr:metal ABC transporter permease [Fusobacteriota bacterium]
MINVINEVIEALSYSFMIKGLIAGSLIALICSILGIFLVLKKFSLIGDGLAHTSFATVAFALLLGQSPIIFSIPLVIIASIIILKITEKTGAYGDSSIGMVSSLCIAVGITIVSVSKGFNVDIYSYLFGSILSINIYEVYVSLALSLIIIILIVLFYNELFVSIYDEDFAKVSGIKIDYINYFLSILTSITVVLGVKVVGTMLVSSLIIFPASSALQISNSFKKSLILASIFGVLSIIIGIIGAYILDIPSSSAIVFVNAIFFVFSFLIKK